MEIIDAHVHLGLPSHREKETEKLSFNLYNDYETFLKCMDISHISRAVVLPIPHKNFNSERSNEYLLEACLKSDGRLIPFCRIDSHLEKNFRNGFCGVKLHLVYEDLEIKNLKQELKLIEEYNVPLLFHARFKNKVQQVEGILKYAPNLFLILAHMGRGHINTDEGIIENAVALKKYDRVFFETSTIIDNQKTGTEKDSVNKVCAILGSHRLIFGTDYPFEKDKYDYQNRVAAFSNGIVDKSVLPDIMFHNIFNMLNLGDDSERVIVRRVKKEDAPILGAFLEALNEEDKKFLALSTKLSHIKTVIRSGNHCYIALVQNTVAGFMRESGRPDNYSLLEEIVVHHVYRRRGIAQKLLDHYHRIFSKTLAKTNAKNSGMIALLKHNGYESENPNAQRIINWSRNNYA
jgi:predicted TIM-barrel fold metal-dependent hydrolase/GNAT superfamily N-acetyltransferase